MMFHDAKRKKKKIGTKEEFYFSIQYITQRSSLNLIYVTICINLCRLGNICGVGEVLTSSELFVFPTRIVWTAIKFLSAKWFGLVSNCNVQLVRMIMPSERKKEKEKVSPLILFEQDKWTLNTYVIDDPIGDRFLYLNTAWTVSNLRAFSCN